MSCFALGCVDFTSTVKELSGTGVVLHDFDSTDEAELSVYTDQKVLIPRRNHPTIFP